MDEIGRNARHVSRLIDSLRETGKLHEKIPLETGGIFRIELNHRSFHQLQEIFVEKTNDNRILAVAKNLSLEEETKENGRQVILVSKDTLVRVKADAIGLIAEDFLSDRVVDFDQLYTGFTEKFIDLELLNQFYEKNELLLSDILQTSRLSQSVFSVEGFIGVARHRRLGSWIRKEKKSKKLVFDHEHIWGITSRNVQQTMAIELLLTEGSTFSHSDWKSGYW